MTTLLYIDASARTDRSLSRGLSKDFKTQWDAIHPEDQSIHRDVGNNPPSCISEDWIAAAFTAKASRTAEQNALLAPSDEYIAEVEKADIIVLSTPMYNYGMPAALKAWFDLIVRVDKTFTFDLARGDFPLEPIMSGKTLLLFTAYGEFGFAQGGVREKMNHLVPHIRTVSKYLGVSDLHSIEIEYQEFGDQRHQASIQQAHSSIPQLIEKLIEQRRKV